MTLAEAIRLSMENKDQYYWFIDNDDFSLMRRTDDDHECVYSHPEYGYRAIPDILSCFDVPWEVA